MEMEIKVVKIDKVIHRWGQFEVIMKINLNKIIKSNY